MKYFISLFLFVLLGCATGGSKKDYMDCLAANVEENACEDERMAWEIRERAMDRRAAQREQNEMVPECPYGYIPVHDKRWDRWYCMSRRDLDRMLGGR